MAQVICAKCYTLQELAEVQGDPPAVKGLKGTCNAKEVLKSHFALAGFPGWRLVPIN